MGKKKILIVALVGVVALAGLAFVARPPSVPPEAIARSVIRDAALLDEAWRLPTASAFPRELHWQSNGSLCGPASLVNVFRSLGDDVADEEQVLAGSGKCRTGACIMGLTLDELAEVAAPKTKRKVTVLRDLDAAAFREHLLRTNDPARRYVVNFHRTPIFGAGGGHHSPIAGYLADKDLVLVLDVNQAFRPWLVERERLFAAMDTLDSASGKKRGLLVVE